jgi:signal peptidase I
METLSTRQSPLRAWVAAVASLILPGLGHFIGGRFVRAGVLLALQVVVDAFTVAAIGFLPLGATAIALGFLVAITWRLWVAVDAYRINRTAATRVSHRAVSWVAATGAFAVAVLSIAATTDAIRWRVGGKTFKLGSQSMAPTLLAGDYVVTRPLEDRPVRRGEIVVFLWPEDATESYIKRVVGLPGDTLAMKDGLLEVNGQRVREEYAIREDTMSDHTATEFAWQQAYVAPAATASSSYKPSRDNWGPLIIPEGSYFVLGDNRDYSLDSRHRGFVRAEQLFARPWRIYFSWDSESGAVRWGRIGRFLHGT